MIKLELIDAHLSSDEELKSAATLSGREAICAVPEEEEDTSSATFSSSDMKSQMTYSASEDSV